MVLSAKVLQNTACATLLVSICSRKNKNPKSGFFEFLDFSIQSKYYNFFYDSFCNMILLFFVDTAELCKTSRKYFSKKYFAQYHPIGEYKRF